MAGVPPTAREIAEAMADNYYAALRLREVPADGREVLVAMLMPAAQVAADAYAECAAVSARVSALVALIAELATPDDEDVYGEVMAGPRWRVLTAGEALAERARMNCVSSRFATGVRTGDFAVRGAG